VPTIVPGAGEGAPQRVQQAGWRRWQSWRASDGERLRGSAGAPSDAQFLQKIPLLLRGTMAAPPERFGETLADEHIRGGTFVGDDGRPLPAREAVPNADMRLFGGAQYHRRARGVSPGGAAHALPSREP
jgi:hypothetical protein